MTKLAIAIRERFHPLFYLRRYVFFQKFTALLNVPVPIRFPEITHPIYGSLTKNMSWIASHGVSGEERERGNFVELLKIGDFKRFFDVGANIGLYGFLFKALVPGGHVMLFEPDPDNAHFIRKTMLRGELPNVQLLETAVGNHVGEVTFKRDLVTGATGTIRAGASFIERHHKAKPKDIQVRLTTLDRIAEGAGDPDLVKIDVEGVEADVLDGARNVIDRATPAIFFECNDKNSRSIIFERLQRTGYVMLDFESMSRVNQLSHNNLALHATKHRDILRHFLSSK